MSPADAPSEGDLSRPRLQILVADDEEMIVKSLERFFTLRGHAVHTACDAQGAISLAESNRYDAALVDARMPGGGHTVIEHLTGDPEFRGRLVLMTGALAADPQVQVSPGVVRVQKPFRLMEIASVVEGEARH